MLQQVGFGVKFIKDYNELNVLRYIKRHGPVSRAEIAKNQHISKAAISEIVARLIRQGFVCETGLGESTLKGGRKPILLKFNEKAGFVIAMEIKPAYSHITLLDINANIHLSKTITYSAGCSLENVLQSIYPVVHQFLQEEWVQNAKPIGIGVGIPGLIDYECGCIKLSDTLKNWQNIPIRDYFEKEFNIQTIIENDVKTITLGECLFGKGADHDNFVNLWLGDGIGAGIILNGLMIRGVTASAGEIGFDELGFYVKNAEDFPLLYNGQKMFGEILSNRWLLTAAASSIRGKYQTRMVEEELSPQYIVTSAINKDPLANQLLKEYGDLLGILCISLINTLNIELIVINGKILSQNDFLLKYVREKVHKDILSMPAHAVQIVAGSLMDHGVVLGATGLVLEDLFYQDTLNVTKYRSIFK